MKIKEQVMLGYLNNWSDDTANVHVPKISECVDLGWNTVAVGFASIGKKRTYRSSKS